MKNVHEGFRTADFRKVYGNREFDIRCTAALQLQMAGTHAELVVTGREPPELLLEWYGPGIAQLKVTGLDFSDDDIHGWVTEGLGNADRLRMLVNIDGRTELFEHAFI